MYEIMQEASTEEKLQDAKDIFDFILFEITSQKEVLAHVMQGRGTTGLNQPHALCKVVRRRNRGIIFLKQEVEYLRAMLDQRTAMLTAKNNAIVSATPEIFEGVHSEASYAGAQGVERPARLMRAESIELGLGDDSTGKREQDESTPMGDVEEVAIDEAKLNEMESDAEAGGDAEEFKSINVDEEDEC